ncbi:MAG TPA: hypothetical protein DET40_04910 [Lentisphaeria bacterium]|nr:MAG: hypothetical protein A2X45_13485 [Lentisphaerae bacterium GWF2_50_93]HCE42866.1 hypothetical protein [Lentisphaeria bacterium]
MEFEIDRPEEIIIVRKIISSMTHLKSGTIRGLCDDSDMGDDRMLRGLRIISDSIEPYLKTRVGTGEHIHIPVGHEGEFINKKPSAFTLGCWHCHATSWRELIKSVIDIISIESDNSFEGTVLKIEGDRRCYFSVNRNELKDPEPIFNRKLFVETNLSANNAVTFLYKAVKAFHYKNFDIA